MRTADDIAADLRHARSELYDSRRRVHELEEEQAHVGLEGYPTEPGWYEDADRNIARLHISADDICVWDDGWGNSGPEFGLPKLPLTRLVPE